MRIIYLHQYFSTTTGGTRSFEAARRLVQMGHDVQMITTDREGSAGGRGWYETTTEGIHVHSLPVAYSNEMSYAARIRAFAQFAIRSCQKAASLRGEVLFATSTPLTIAIPALYASKRNHVPWVFEVRDLWPEVPIALGALKSPLMVMMARKLERLAYHDASHIVALSPDMRDGVLAQGVAPDKVTVLPNACDEHTFAIGPGPGLSLRESVAWLQDRPLILYAGALGLVNGVGYIAQIAAAARPIDPELRFLIIGEGRERDAITSMAQEVGVLNQNLFMLPAMAKSDVARWLSAATIATSFVIDVPALHANSANKVFDALASGTPVAINHEGWQADFLRAQNAGVVLPASDPEAAARALVFKARDTTWLREAGLAADGLAREHFNRDDIVRQLEQILREVVDSKSGAHSQ